MKIDANARKGPFVRFAMRLFAVVVMCFLFNASLLFSASAVQAAEPCSLSSSFETSGGNMQAAGTMNYLLTAKNVGGSACSSASISVYYADDETFVSSSPKPTADGYYWQLGNLGPGQGTSITLTTSRSAGLPAGDSSDELCLSADNGTDSCSNAAPTAVAVTPPPPAPTSTTVTAPTSTPPVAATSSPSSSSLPKKQELGLWDWDTPSTVSTPEMQTAVNDAATNGVNAIYLSIDDYLTIDAMPAGKAKTADLTNYEAKLTTFLTLAAQKGISVDAESGADDWAEPQNLWKSADIMSFVASYNATHAEKFRGAQSDVEPYLLPAYANDEASVLTQYAELVQGLVKQDQGNKLGLPLSLDIPSFYDDVIQWTPEITVGGVTNYAYNQLLRLLSPLPNSTLLIMAYRNFAVGPNGTIDLSDTEAQEAKGTGVRVIVGQETGNVQPSYVTFYGKTKANLFAQMSLVTQSFSSNPSFAGMAIDYLEPFMALK